MKHDMIITILTFSLYNPSLYLGSRDPHVEERDLRALFNLIAKAILTDLFSALCSVGEAGCSERLTASNKYLAVPTATTYQYQPASCQLHWPLLSAVVQLNSWASHNTSLPAVRADGGVEVLPDPCPGHVCARAGAGAGQDHQEPGQADAGEEVQ